MPAEQLVNLYQDTVGSAGYVAGSGTLPVSSGSGAPASGPFTVTILNSAGTAILLLFRVTSLVGPVFTGAAEGPDVNAPAGSIVIGSTLSVAAINNLFASTGGAFIQPLTAPNHSSFTQTNYSTGSGVTTTEVDNTSPVTSVTILQHDPNGTNEIAALFKNKVAATFTVTIGFTFAGGNDNGIVGLALTDGTNVIIFAIQASTGVRIPLFSNINGTFSIDIIGDYSTPLLGGIVFFRIKETASARIYYMSSDGITFAQIFTESNTAHMTTTQYGFAVEGRGVGTVNPDTMGTMYSFTESNP
jgi:hypothetical protein